MADVALAGQILVPHYAAPVARHLVRDAKLRQEENESAEIVAELSVGAPFDLLDSRGEWAWGYGGKDRLVGYVRIEALD